MMLVTFINKIPNRLTSVDRISTPNESSRFASFNDGPEIILKVLVVARTESNP